MYLEKQTGSVYLVIIVRETMSARRTDVLPIKRQAKESQAFITIRATKEIREDINRL